MTRRGDTLIDSIIATGDDATAHALLNEFFSGYPVDELRRLLRSDNEQTARIGVWIASELGWRSRSVIAELTRLLAHPSRYVRFFAVDAILAAGGTEHGEAIAAAVQALDDADEALRWKAMNFLARATHEQLVACIPYIERTILASLVRWLLDRDRTPDSGEIVARIGSSQPLERRFAGAAAARLAMHDRSALEYAAGSGDREVSSFAEEQIKALEDKRRKTDR